MSTISILLADDHALVRSGLRSLLERMPRITVVGEAYDGRAVLNFLQTRQVDIVLMDIGMPVLSGIEATGRIKGAFPNVRVIILSMHKTEDYVGQALRAGCSGYVLKDAATDELALAIRSVAQGDSYLSPAVTSFLINDFLKHNPRHSTPLDKLTHRQREILQLVAEGRTSAEISQVLDLSIKTVEAHRGEIMSRLGIHDIAGLTRFAVRNGIVSA